MSVPAHVRQEVKERLWAEADRLSWSTLSTTDKSRYYTLWTETEEFGGRLDRYMDARQVRVYIKDTLLKSYARETSANPAQARRVLDIAEEAQIAQTYIKPHGLLLVDERQIAWSKASEWKATLMALHERGFDRGTPYAAVFTESGAKYGLQAQRLVVENAAQKLGIERVVWLE